MDMLTAGGRMAELTLVFHLEEQAYGLPLAVVREILPMVAISPVPYAPDFIRGVINLRGTIVPIIHMRRKLHIPPRDPGVRSCLVIAEAPERVYGFVADRVTDCIEVTEISKPDEGRGDDRHFIRGLGDLGGRIITLLDPERILSTEERLALRGF
jgi:purine-binding chemotaxis protein CheW